MLVLHIYCGEGKGKTTAAVGLSVRAAGQGLRVVFAQFLKSGGSGERRVLSRLPEVTLLEVPEQMAFVWAMDAAERAAVAGRQREMFNRAAALAEGADLLVLDELCGALETGMVELAPVLSLLDRAGERLEVVITGRTAPPELMQRADYVTRMCAEKHPFDRGIPARRGIEW